MREIYLIAIKVLRKNLYLWSNQTNNHTYYYLVRKASQGLARGMPPASNQYTRHDWGNGYGGSPRHASATRLFNKFQISIQYRLLIHYQTCIGDCIRVHYVRHSHTHCIIRWDNHLTIQYGIHSIASRKQRVRPGFTGRTRIISVLYMRDILNTFIITQINIPLFRVKIVYMRYYLNFYLKSNVGSIIGNYSYMAIIASYQLQRRMVAKGGGYNGSTPSK